MRRGHFPLTNHRTQPIVFKLYSEISPIFLLDMLLLRLVLEQRLHESVTNWLIIELSCLPQ